MKGLRSIVALSRDSMRGVDVLPIEGEPPSLEWAKPGDLFVEEEYQRDVAESGTSLIRKIAGAFSWYCLKPPICFVSEEHGGVKVIVDGQHTAIGAATRGVPEIPILLFTGAGAEVRARSFVAHNQNRVALTMLAVFHAQLAHNEPLAAEMKRVCDAAGVKILTKAINLSEQRPVGETMAIGAIRTILKKHGPEKLQRVMMVLVGANRGPIKAQEITGVSIVLFAGKREQPYETDVRLSALIASRSARQWQALAVNESGTTPQALATLWLRDLELRLSPAESIPRAAPSLLPKTPAHDKPGAPFDNGKRPNDKPVGESVKLAAVPARPAATAPAPAKAFPVDLPPAAAPKPKAPVFLTQSNGISVQATGTVTRVGYGTSPNVGNYGATLVARLVSVMPAQIPHERLAQNVFPGKASARQMLGDLVAAVNADLRRCGLEIFEVRSSGYMIRDRV